MKRYQLFYLKLFSSSILSIFTNFVFAQLSPSQAVKTLPYVYNGDLNSMQNWGGTGIAGMYIFNSNRSANIPFLPDAQDDPWFHVIEMQHDNSDSWIGQIGMDYRNDGGLFWRQQEDNKWRDWRKVASENWSLAQFGTRYRNNAGLQGNNGATSGFYETPSPINFPNVASGWWHLLDVRHSNNANNFAMQFSGSFFDQNLYFRKTNDNPSTAWSRVVLETNNMVGIGTISPSEKLHVYDGKLQLSGPGNNGIKIGTNNAYNYNYFSVTAQDPGHGIVAGFAPGGDNLSSPYAFQFSSDASAAARSNLLIAGVGGNKHVIASDASIASASPWDITFRAAATGVDWNSAPDAITIKAGAPADMLYLNANGNVGVGTSNPQAKLHVNGGNLMIGTNPGSGNYTVLSAGISAPQNGYSFIQSIKASGTSYGDLILNADGGNVGIGTSNPGTFRLAVEGKIGARKIVVTQANGWADYVFDSDYMLLPLSELNAFVQANKHLPGIPSAATIEKEGLDVGETQKLMMKKIEELTLYIIEQEKKIAEINTKMQQYESKLGK